MDIALILRALYALFVVGLLLFGLWYMARLTGRNRITGFAGKRLITVLETAYLAQQTTVHVVKVGARYLLIGASSTGVSQLTELKEEDMQPWMDEQRRLLSIQPSSLGDFVKRLRGQ